MVHKPLSTSTLLILHGELQCNAQCCSQNPYLEPCGIASALHRPATHSIGLCESQNASWTWQEVTETTSGHVQGAFQTIRILQGLQVRLLGATLSIGSRPTVGKHCTKGFQTICDGSGIIIAWNNNDMKAKQGFFQINQLKWREGWLHSGLYEGIWDLTPLAISPTQNYGTGLGCVFLDGQAMLHSSHTSM